MSKKRSHFLDISKDEITLAELIYYNLLFFVPITVSFFISSFLSKKVAHYFEASPKVLVSIFMLGFTLLIFFLIVPYIRKRENVKGVRFALIGFIIVAISMTIPAIIVQKNYGMLYGQLLYLGGYIFATFIYCPEVLGIEGDLKHWFEQGKQLIVLFVYTAIVICYVVGFAQVYHEIALDNPEAFNVAVDKGNGFGTYLYYSVVTFVTVGYGEITPVSTAARLTFGIQAMISFIMTTVFIAILLLYVSNSQLWAQEEEEKKFEKEERKIEKEEREILTEERGIKNLLGFGTKKEIPKQRKSKKKKTSKKKK
jgi:hypothetical protein